MLAVCTPWDEKEATVGNGVMVALDAGSPEVVQKVYAKAMELGGTDEGEPGPRGDAGFYGGYFRDLDGNKLVAFTFGG
jgi:predicted lactoylglutathione lyase